MIVRLVIVLFRFKFKFRNSLLCLYDISSLFATWAYLTRFVRKQEIAFEQYRLKLSFGSAPPPGILNVTHHNSIVNLTRNHSLPHYRKLPFGQHTNSIIISTISQSATVSKVLKVFHLICKAAFAVLLWRYTKLPGMSIAYHFHLHSPFILSLALEIYGSSCSRAIRLGSSEKILITRFLL